MQYLSKLIPKTLFARFLLIITIPVILGQLLAVYIFYNRHWYNVSNHTSKMIASNISLILQELKQDNFENAEQISRELTIHYLIHQNKKSIVQLNSLEELEILHDAISDKTKDTNMVYLSDDNNKIIVSLPYKDGVVEFHLPSKILINPSAYIFVLWLIFLTIILLSISIIFSKNQIRSILSLVKVADAYGKGINSKVRYKPSGAAEIRLAGIAFIRMKERIERNINRRSKMLAMISHDLRTPITRIKLQLELMDKSDEQIAIQEDLVQMEHIIASYLDYIRGEGAEAFVLVDLYSWFSNEISSTIPIKLNSNIKFNKNHSISISIKPIAMKRAINNIISNAARYADKINISLKEENNNVIIEAEDNGCGISDLEKDKVFQPFYRSDKGRNLNSNSTNTGLGLAIASEIITAHQGTITLHNSQTLGGLLVRITLPNLRN